MKFLPTVFLCTMIGAMISHAAAAEDDVVFRSDVALVRVDTQVMDQNHRAITGLRQEDFVLREEGREQPIRAFASENIPTDVLILLDVSGSMRFHVERLASASHQALQVMGRDDRVGVMVFDRAARLRLPFRNNLNEVERGLDGVLRQETFNGGTDIHAALDTAIDYVARNARREARKAIVIMTDDQTERRGDETGIIRRLTREDIVLSLLLAPDVTARRMGTPPPMGGGWPGRGGRGGRGGIIFGPGGGGYPGRTGGGYPRRTTRSANTPEIARRSGGDRFDVEDAAALETTLSRLRQRYAIHFYLPQGARPGQERTLDVELTAAARRRYPGAEVSFRKTYVVPDGAAQPASAPVYEPITVTRAEPGPSTDSADTPKLRRRPMVSERTGGPNPAGGSTSSGNSGGWRKADEPPGNVPPEPATAPAKPAPSKVDPATVDPPTADQKTEDPAAAKQGGWRRVKPGEKDPL